MSFPSYHKIRFNISKGNVDIVFTLTITDNHQFKLRHSIPSCGVTYGTPTHKPPVMLQLDGMWESPVFRVKTSESRSAIVASIARAAAVASSETLPCRPIYYHLHCWLHTPVSRLPQHAPSN